MKIRSLSGGAAALSLLLTVPAIHAASLIGPGIFTTSSAGGESGNRLNISDQKPGGASSGVHLQKGYYRLDDFSFVALDAATGTVTPFLASSTDASNYNVFWIGSGVASSAGTVRTDPAGGFYLNAPATVYAGFYTNRSTSAPIQIAYQNTGRTDHNNPGDVPPGSSATVTLAPGSYSTFTNSNLGRSYSFGITVSPTINVGPGLVSTGNADSGGNRLNIDRMNTTTVAAGKYTVENFMFNPTSSSGQVTPFLARLVGNTYEFLWVGNAVSGLASGTTKSTDYLNQILNLTTTTTLYSGFFTEAGATVAYSDGTGLTGHDNTPVLPTLGGSLATTDISHHSLGRTYAFAIALSIPEPGRVLMTLGFGVIPLLLRRRKYVR